MRFTLCSLITAFLFSQFQEISTTETQDTSVYHENDVAKTIFTYMPGNEMMYSALYPVANLYGRSMSSKLAQMEHKQMVEALKVLNATVVDLKELYLKFTEIRSSDEWHILHNLTLDTIQYDTSKLAMEFKKVKSWCVRLSPKPKARCMKQLKELEPQLETSKQDKVIKEALHTLDPESLWEIIVNRPIIELHLVKKLIGKEPIVGMESIVEIKPLGSLYFLRDQQITTSKGIVVLKSPFREDEVQLTKDAFLRYGLHIECTLQGHVFAEGGDYVQVGDLAFFGQGLRTSLNAIKYLMKRDCFGVGELAIVRDYSDFHSDRLHLDSFFNILDDKGNVLILDAILTKHKRFVDLYTFDPKGKVHHEIGRYVLNETKVEFGKFLKERGFNLIRVTKEEQLKFAINFLNIGRGNIVTSYGEESYLQKLRSVGVTPYFVEMSHLTTGNGGIRCMTQVVHRERGTLKTKNIVVS